MKTTLKKVCVIVSWLYAASVVLWFILHSWLGDTIWWLALLNSFVPFLFVPLTLILPVSLFFRQRSFWASALPPVAVFLLLYRHLFLPTWSLGSATEGTSLTIMSFNIWGYSRSEETAHAILEGEIPKIVALQELAPEMAEVLVKEIGDIYPHRVINIGSREYGVAVFSQYPLTELDASYLTDPNWRVQIFRVEEEGQAFILYNVHLQVSNVLAYFEEGVSVAGEVEASVRNREAQVRRLVADIATRSEPVIVVGDFNSTDQSSVYGILTEGLTDAHQAVGWGFGHTFPAYGGNWRGIPIIPRQMRLDMIFYSNDFVALSSRVGAAHGESDHLPVSAKIAWRR